MFQVKDLDPASPFVTDFLWDLKVVNLRSILVQQGFSAVSNDCKPQMTSVLQGTWY